MFGLGKRKRARKHLSAALGIFLPGDGKSQSSILERSESDTDSAVLEIAQGGDPYIVTAKLVATYIQDALEEIPLEDRQYLLRNVFVGNTRALPISLRLAIHIGLALARLESGNKPLVPAGTTSMFLERVATAFTDQENMKKKIAGHLYNCAVKIAESGKKKTG